MDAPLTKHTQELTPWQDKEEQETRLGDVPSYSSSSSSSLFNRIRTCAILINCPGQGSNNLQLPSIKSKRRQSSTKLLFILSHLLLFEQQQQQRLKGGWILLVQLSIRVNYYSLAPPTPTQDTILIKPFNWQFLGSFSIKLCKIPATVEMTPKDKPKITHRVVNCNYLTTTTIGNTQRGWWQDTTRV